MSRLDLVVGPNGAGKSTYVEHVLLHERPTVPFVNADVIAAQRWPDDAEAMSLEAARVAAATRLALLDAGRDFIAETVFSHPTKVEFVRHAAAQGYAVHLHVLLIPLELSGPRVAQRVRVGGHSVPASKLAARYERIWPLVAAAVPLSAHARFWDNAGHDGPHAVATFRHGVPDIAPTWPRWTPSPLLAL